MGFLNPIIPDALDQLNRAHGLANGLVSAFQFNAAGKPVDLVNPKRGVTVSNYAFAGTGANGPSFKASATNGYITIAPGVGSIGLWTVSALTRFPIDNNTFAVFARSAGASLLHVTRNSSTDALASYISGGARNFSPTIAPLTLSGWKRLTVTGHAGGVIAYLDGVFAGSHTFVANASIDNILGDPGNLAWGEAKDYFIWNKTLNPGEVMEHALDPWAMFRNDDWLGTVLASIGGSSGAGTSVGAAVVSGIGVALAAGVATSVGLGVAAAIGAAVAVAVGTIAGIAALSGIGAELAAATATSAGTATAPGKSAGPGIGTAAGVGTANGITLSLVVSGVGTATGTSIVLGLSPPVWTQIPPAVAAWVQQNAAAASWSLVASLSATWTKQYP